MRAFAKTFIAIVVVFLAASALNASQPLETETARLLPAGGMKIEAATELQRSRDGRERAWPFVFEYGLTNRTELTIEPVFATAIRPRSGRSANGFGDVEMTLTHLLLAETAGGPAFAVAAEIKFPTARNSLIGTRKTDYTAWAIASKRFERFDVHGNLGITVVGRPAGVRLHNIVDYALAEEFHLSPRFDIVSEFVGNTSSTGETTEGAPAPGSGTLPPEAAAAESSILLGGRYFIRPALFFSLGLSYDNNHALLIRPGITYRFGR